MAGVRKFTFKTPIVTTTEKVTNIIVNSRYFPEIGKKIFQLLNFSTYTLHLPNRGTDMEVGGMISANSKKNTVNDRRIEMERDT